MIPVILTYYQVTTSFHSIICPFIKIIMYWNVIVRTLWRIIFNCDFIEREFNANNLYFFASFETTAYSEKDSIYSLICCLFQIHIEFSSLPYLRWKLTKYKVTTLRDVSSLLFRQISLTQEQVEICRYQPHKDDIVKIIAFAGTTYFILQCSTSSVP